jgi:integrase
MATRRAHGEGSIFQAADGRWHGMVDLPPGPNGQRRRRKVTGHNRKEVAAKLEQARREVAAGVVVDKRLTVGDYLADWLDRREQADDVTPATIRNYRDVTRLYLTPAIGTVKLDALTPQQVEQMTAAMMKGAPGRRPVAARTAALARAVLRKALTDAAREGMVARNVAQMARAPRQPRREGRTLSPTQAKTLLAAVADHRLAAAFVVSLMLGLRRGELLGLHWSDVDLDAGTLTVRHQLQRVAGELVIVDTKTAGSVRRLALPGPALDALKRHRGANPGLPGALIFTSETGTPMDPDNWRRLVYNVTEKAFGERWGPHELRHSAASIMLAAGVPLKMVSEVLGHSSIRITADIYSHVLGTDRTAADAMAKVLG